MGAREAVSDASVETGIKGVEASTFDVVEGGGAV